MKPIIIVLFLAAGPARAADPYVFIPPVLPARQGDLAELSYRLAQLPALSELERAQTAAAHINTWPYFMGGVVMVRNHSGSRIQTFCVWMFHNFEYLGYLTPAGVKVLPGWYTWKMVLLDAAPWARQGHWLLQGGGLSSEIFNIQKEETK